MKPLYALMSAVGICVVAAALEGVCAGRNVAGYFATLRFPSYSFPLKVWYAIGGIYYLVFCFIIYRLLRVEAGSQGLTVTCVLVGFMMLANGFSNIVIFRLRDLFLSFLIGAVFPLLDLLLFAFLWNLDKVAAYSMTPYLVYRVYAVIWGYGLWQANRRGEE
jgi:tryptophan-rich sensory protein